MRDFQHEEDSGSVYTGVVPVPEFSWSPARHNLFQTCKRAYFFRYYLAQGGWNKFASPQARAAYRDKYVLTFNQWLSRTLQEAIREALRLTIHSQPGKKERDFSFHLLQSISKSASDLSFSLKNKEYLADPKMPVILEYLRRKPGFYPPDKLSERAVQILSGTYAALLKMDFLLNMIHLDFTDLLLDDKFFSLELDDFYVWFNPGLLFFHRDRVCTLKCEACPETESNGDMLARFSVESAIFDLYAKGRFPGRQTACRSIAFNQSGCTICLPPDAGNVLAKMRKSAAAMRKLIRPNGTVAADDFAPCEDRTRCQMCQYRKTCKLIYPQEFQKANEPKNDEEDGIAKGRDCQKC